MVKPGPPAENFPGGGAQKSSLKIFTSHHFNLIFRRSSANLSTFKEISNVHFAKFLPSRLQNTRYVVHTAVKTTSQYGIWAIGRMRWVAVRATPASRSIIRCNSAQRTLCVADRGDFSSNICENPNISISTSIFQGRGAAPCRRPWMLPHYSNFLKDYNMTMGASMG